MTTTIAFLGDFGDAIQFIFQGETTQEGTEVGGSQFLELTWERLKLSLVAMAVACASRSRPGSGSVTSAAAASWRSASRTSAGRYPAWP